MAQGKLTACACPRDFPAWDGKDIDLGGQAVHRLPMPTLFGMPLSFDLYRQRQQQDLERLGLQENWPGFVLMRTGLLRGEVIRLLKEDSQSLSRHVQRLPGPFWARAVMHHGEVGTLRHTLVNLQSELFNAGRAPKSLFLAHLTCPLCSAERGGSKILVVRHWQADTKLTAKLQKRAS